jgi:hypothetical protein
MLPIQDSWNMMCTLCLNAGSTASSPLTHFDASLPRLQSHWCYSRSALPPSRWSNSLPVVSAHVSSSGWFVTFSPPKSYSNKILQLWIAAKPVTIWPPLRLYVILSCGLQDSIHRSLYDLQISSDVGTLVGSNSFCSWQTLVDFVAPYEPCIATEAQIWFVRSGA